MKLMWEDLTGVYFMWNPVVAKCNIKADSPMHDIEKSQWESKLNRYIISSSCGRQLTIAHL
jgi:hypothetical protein